MLQQVLFPFRPNLIFRPSEIVACLQRIMDDNAFLTKKYMRQVSFQYSLNLFEPYFREGLPFSGTHTTQPGFCVQRLMTLMRTQVAFVAMRLHLNCVDSAD